MAARGAYAVGSGVYNRRQFNRYEEYDTHEMLKREMASQPADNVYSSYTQAVSDPQPGQSVVPSAPSGPQRVHFRDVAIYFDSIYASRDARRSGEITWSIPPLNFMQDLNNVVRLQIGSFYFPVPFLANQHPNPTYQRDYLSSVFYHRRAYMDITTIPSSQAVQMPGRRYFFEFEIGDVNAYAVEFRPIKSTYVFQAPVTSLNEITVRFFVQLNGKMMDIPIPYETVRVKFVSAPNMCEIIDGKTTLEVFGPPEQFGSQILITVKEYFGTSPLRTMIMRDTGYYVDNILDATSFTVQFGDFRPDVNDELTLYVPQNRIAFPLTFTALSQTQTQLISVVNT